MFKHNFLRGFLFDAAGDGSGAGGGAGDPAANTPITADAVQKLITQSNESLLAKFAQIQADAEKKRQDADAARAEEERKKQASAEEERKRQEEADKANQGTQEQQLAHKLKLVERDLQEQKQRTAQAEEASRLREQQMLEEKRQAEIRKALNGFQFPTPKAADVAYSHVQSGIRWDSNNKLVGPEGISIADHLSEQFRLGGELEFLLAPKSNGGSGATGPGGASVPGTMDLDNIKAGGNNDAARQFIARLSSDVLAGRR